MEEGIRVIKWLDDVTPIPMRTLDKWVSFEDDTPIRPTIYVGGSGDLERYRSMAQHNQSIAFPASIFGGSAPPQPLPSSSTLHVAVSASSSVSHKGTTGSSTLDSAGLNRSSRMSSRKSPCTYLQFAIHTDTNF